MCLHDVSDFYKDNNKVDKEKLGIKRMSGVG